ncbi:DNA circularization N-terminal domain-containing protein [Klebsiella pneumoniae]|uniref:DNA circularization N-terminal domain-containing protein n=1 Tax=Klebsiella pneumoniae TaxID=573 RepID=UPI003558C947
MADQKMKLEITLVNDKGEKKTYNVEMKWQNNNRHEWLTGFKPPPWRFFYSGGLMAIIQDAITSLMGGGGSEDWLGQLRPGSFQGVPFAVVNEEGSHGRRQAVHEYPYQDTAWIEDMGRGTRRFIIRGFIVQNNSVYGGGDVISQRQALINACEAKGSGTLIPPTLGENDRFHTRERVKTLWLRR